MDDGPTIQSNGPKRNDTNVKAMPTSYKFRRAGDQDLPMLHHWQSLAHVAKWYGDERLTVEELCDPRIAMWIAEYRGRPFAFVQDYDVHAWPGHHFGFLPAHSRGLDMFIAEVEMIGIGHGSALLESHASTLISEGAPVLGIDPHPDNGAAIRAYEKAHFKLAGGPMETPWGRVVLMTREAIHGPGDGSMDESTRQDHK
ncbi:GNAT family N-acetyltransferase [Nitratireductor thuwali]|uniref:GNAT family N-acetyltransferase n=1 Tax=Nitratireductor thuwali TaxID=2267699 RepID=UPI0030CC94FE